MWCICTYFCGISLILKVNSHTEMHASHTHERLHVHVCPFAVPVCPCGRWFVSVCLLSRALRHCAICNQAGSQEAHIGAHMTGHHTPAHSPPTQSHTDTFTCLYSTCKCQIIMFAFHNLLFAISYILFKKLSEETLPSPQSFLHNLLTICCSGPKSSFFNAYPSRFLPEKEKNAQALKDVIIPPFQQKLHTNKF